MLKQLGKQRIANVFVHLRKIAQHPLLVRDHYSEAQVQRIAATAYKRSAPIELFVGFSGLSSLSDFQHGSAMTTNCTAQELIEHLAKLAANHKQVLFCMLYDVHILMTL